MIPYYFELTDFLPFKKESLIDISCLTILTDVIDENFVRKDNYSPDVLSPAFSDYLNDLSLEIRKIIVWHWKTTNPSIAHVDSGPTGETINSAINWTLNENRTQVNFYDINVEDYEVSIGNSIVPEWKMDNVGSFIPIYVKDVTPTAIWSGTEPCLINPFIPHMVEAPELRVTVSLQFKENHSFLDVMNRIAPSRITT